MTHSALGQVLRPTMHCTTAHTEVYGSPYDPQCTGAGPQCSEVSTHDAPGQAPRPTMHCAMAHTEA